MAFPTFDPAKHHRDLLGRFATTTKGHEGPAAQRFRSGGLARIRLERQYGHDERRLARRGAGAFEPPRPGAVARERHAQVVGKAHEVHGAYAARARGTASWRQQLMTEYASPTARAKAQAETGTVLRPRREAMQTNVSLVRPHGTPRKETKRAFGGKNVAVRGYGREYTDAAGYTHSSKHVRNLAGRPGVRPSRASVPSEHAALEKQVKGLRRRGLENLAAQRGVKVSTLWTDAKVREVILGTASR